MSELDEKALRKAARAIQGADALLIGAGAGMGVDSGLPDFRGPEGFWRAYPPYAKLGLRFEQLASPAHFRSDPPLAWGFYGHRTNLYRQTMPHEGFAILKRWGDRMEHGAFAFTSNVDDHFAKAGFDPRPDRRVPRLDRLAAVPGRLRDRDLPRRRGRGPRRPVHLPRRRTLAGLPRVRRPGPAQHPDVRRLEMGFPADRPATTPDHALAERPWPGPARDHRIRCRSGDPDRPTLQRAGGVRPRGDPDPREPPRVRCPVRSDRPGDGGPRSPPRDRRSHERSKGPRVV